MIAPLASLLLASSALAAPASSWFGLNKRAMNEYHADVTIHESCNVRTIGVLSLFLTDRFPLFQVTETRQLTKALKEVKEIAGVTKNYLVANGPQDPLFQTYCEQSEDW
jgi:hypothetical protein